MYSQENVRTLAGRRQAYIFGSDARELSKFGWYTDRGSTRVIRGAVRARRPKSYGVRNGAMGFLGATVQAFVSFGCLSFDPVNYKLRGENNVRMAGEDSKGRFDCGEG